MFDIKAKASSAHWSDCASHNEPEYPAGECDCGAAIAGQGFFASLLHLGCIHFAPTKRSLQRWIARKFCSVEMDASQGEYVKWCVMQDLDKKDAMRKALNLIFVDGGQ